MSNSREPRQPGWREDERWRPREVRSSSGETLGRADGALVDEQGDVRAVVVRAGGVLGIGDRRYEVPAEDIEFEGDGSITLRTESAVTGPGEAPPEARFGEEGFYGYAPYWEPGFSQDYPPTADD